MIVINAHINQVSDFDDFEADIFRKDLEALGIDDFISVGEVSHLLNTLEVNKSQDGIILISNFSPNIHFKYHGIDVNKFGIKPIINWRAKQYSFSAALFNYICKNYPITEIHFITSALKRFVNDIDFRAITNEVHTTIKRKRDWFYSNSDIPYNVFLKKYMLDKIYAALNSIVVPRHQKLLLEKFMSKYCQN